MKRAKIMLTAICVLAVVGGALAFKVKSQANVFCLTPSTGACDKIAFTTIKPNVNPPAATTTNPCPNETVFYTENGCQTTFIETQNTVYATNL